MMLAAIILLLAGNCLWICVAARLSTHLQTTKRDLELIGACNERLTRELMQSRAHVDAIAANGRFRAFRN